MDEKTFIILDSICDRITFGIIRVGNRELRFDVLFPEDFDGIDGKLKSDLIDAVSSFLKDIMEPIGETILNKFRGHTISKDLVSSIEYFIKEEEKRIVHNGGKNFINEIKSRLGLLPSVEKLNIELTLTIDA